MLLNHDNLCSSLLNTNFHPHKEITFSWYFQIGLMRNGILLAEDSPQNILSRFEVDSLEDAFLQLCMRHGKTWFSVRVFFFIYNLSSAITGVSDEADNNLKQIKTFSNQIQIPGEADKTNSNEKTELKRRNSVDSDKIETCCGGVGDINCNKKSFMRNLQFTTKRRMKALLAKNFLQMVRQPA